MRQIVLFVFATFGILSCTNTTGLNKYFEKSEAAELKTNIVTYIISKPSKATNETKFNSEFKKYYSENAESFSIEDIERTEDSSFVFFMTRPVGNLATFKRGVIGKFKLKKGSLIPTEFEEIVNTPHLKKEEVIERGNFLFKSYLKNKTLNNFLAMKHYIEWPDSTLVYNKASNEWVKP
jgi:hypothetical protein